MYIKPNGKQKENPVVMQGQMWIISAKFDIGFTFGKI